MEMDEPPSCQTASLFLIGKNSRGNWVAQDQRHVCGGLFVNRTEAFKFALSENGHRPQAIVMVPGVLELDMGPRAAIPVHVNRHAVAQERRVA